MLSLYKSHYSLLRSILTLEDAGSTNDPDLPPSILDMAIEAGQDTIWLVEDTLASLLPAYLACKKSNLKLRFGFRCDFVEDAENKTDDSWLNSHKNVIFFKNKAGYHKLIELSTLCNYHNYYKGGRLDYNQLHSHWSDDLLLAVPFYDSFIFKNHLEGKACIPDFRNIPIIFFLEQNDLPFDDLIREEVTKYSKENSYETLETKSIYYKNREDFDAWQTLKCLNRKKFGSGRTLEDPGLEHCGSKEFCLESYLEKVKKNKTEEILC